MQKSSVSNMKKDHLRCVNQLLDRKLILFTVSALSR